VGNCPGLPDHALRRDILQKAFEAGWLSDGKTESAEKIWLDMAEDRNLTSHTYREQTAEELFQRLPRYAKHLREALERLNQEFR
jgi:nucleotidyltransferase substrate binding protein (TIGR01987 family)